MSRENKVLTILPVPAVSIAVFKNDAVLLARRGKGELKGIWSLPGGHIKPGEKTMESVRRELMEETGVTAGGIKYLACHDVLLRDENGLLTAHYVLNVYYGKWKSGHAQAASDCIEVRWTTPEFLSQFSLTPGAQDLILRASKLILR